jgi:riboflavin synthase
VFSGIVKGTGRVIERIEIGGDLRATIAYDTAAMPPPVPGASIAVNGGCLTAAACGDGRFEADVSSETLAVTTLASLHVDSRVNLEPSLKLGEGMDGHWVTGHVDGVGHVLATTPAARSVILSIGLPAALARYVARKGSIAVDGVSLTVNQVGDTAFEVNVIPHTGDVTIISDYAVGRAVNLEVDIVARYLERLIGESRL